MANKNNRGPNWGTNGFDKRTPEELKVIATKGGKTSKLPKEKLLDALTDDDIAKLVKARQQFINAMAKDADKDDFGKMKWWAKNTHAFTENRKPVAEVKKAEEVKTDHKLTIEVDLTVPVDNDDKKDK